MIPSKVNRKPTKLFCNFCDQSPKLRMCVMYSITAVADFPKKYIPVTNNAAYIRPGINTHSHSLCWMMKRWACPQDWIVITISLSKT